MLKDEVVHDRLSGPDRLARSGPGLIRDRAYSWVSGLRVPAGFRRTRWIRPRAARDTDRPAARRAPAMAARREDRRDGRLRAGLAGRAVARPRTARPCHGPGDRDRGEGHRVGGCHGRRLPGRRGSAAGRAARKDRARGPGRHPRGGARHPRIDRRGWSARRADRPRPGRRRDRHEPRGELRAPAGDGLQGPDRHEPAAALPHPRVEPAGLVHGAGARGVDACWRTPGARAGSSVAGAARSRRDGMGGLFRRRGSAAGAGG